MENPRRQLPLDRADLNRNGSTHHPAVFPFPVGVKMSSHTPEPSEETDWESVHKCSQCGYEHNLAKLDLRETTTGIATCPRCERSGQIDLQIVPRQRLGE
jgi:hypothetical protein